MEILKDNSTVAHASRALCGWVAGLLLVACGGGSEGTADSQVQPDLESKGSLPLSIVLAPPRQVGESTRIQLSWTHAGPVATITPQRRLSSGQPFMDLPPLDVFERGSALQYDFPTAKVRLRACDASGRCVNSNEQALLDALLDTTADVRPDATAINAVFGNRVALSRDGNTLAVAAPTERVVDDPRFPGIGTVFVFSRGPGGRWQQDARLHKLHLPGNFGDPFALSGDGRTLAVGNYTASGTQGGIDPPEIGGSGDWRGAVAVYVRGSDNRWNQQAWLQADITRANEMFGYRVALCKDGNTLLVAASDRMLLFRRDAGRWSQVRTFEATAVDRSINPSAGMALSADGTAIAVSASQAVPNTDRIRIRAVDVWRRCGNCAGGWSAQADLRSLKPPRFPYDDDGFGESLAFSADGRVLAAGAPDDADTGETRDDAARSSGAVYLFAADRTGAWQRRAFLKARKVVAGDVVGTQVVIDDAGRLVLASACGGSIDASGLRRNHRAGAEPPSQDGSCSFGGAAYAFSRGGDSRWSHTSATLAQAPGNIGFVFFALALSGDARTYALGQQVYTETANFGRVVVY